MESRESTNVWSLRVDLAWAHVLLRLVAVPGVTTPRPEVHYFLFDRYFRLSEVYRGRGGAPSAFAAWPSGTSTEVAPTLLRLQPPSHFLCPSVLPSPGL